MYIFKSGLSSLPLDRFHACLSMCQVISVAYGHRHNIVLHVLAFSCRAVCIGRRRCICKLSVATSASVVALLSSCVYINLLFLISIAFLKQWRQRYSHAQGIALYGYLSRKVLTLPFFCPDLVGPTEVICACRKLQFSLSAIWMSYLCRLQHIICTPSKENC